MRQNPNMIRTLLLLSFTLIFLLAYAVYGASSNSGYYVYESEQNSTSPELSAIGTNPIYQNGKTVWIWEFETNTNNLTWINVSVEGGVENSILKVINIDGNFWSHPELGYELEDLPNGDVIIKLLAEVGDYATKHNHRFTTHPGPFNVLASPNEEVVRKAVIDLNCHSKMFDYMGFEPSTKDHSWNLYY